MRAKQPSSRRFRRCSSEPAIDSEIKTGPFEGRRFTCIPPCRSPQPTTTFFRVATRPAAKCYHDAPLDTVLLHVPAALIAGGDGSSGQLSDSRACIDKGVVGWKKCTSTRPLSSFTRPFFPPSCVQSSCPTSSGNGTTPWQQLVRRIVRLSHPPPPTPLGVKPTDQGQELHLFVDGPFVGTVGGRIFEPRRLFLVSPRPEQLVVGQSH